MKEYAHYPYFLEVCKHSSFSIAAEKLGIAQSSVSYQVNRLESLLGTTLLKRTQGAKLQLTRNGEVLFQELLKHDKSIGQVITSISPSKRKTNIVVGAPEDLGAYLIAPLIHLPNKSKLKFDLRLEDSVVDLYSENIDIAIRRKVNGGNWKSVALLKAENKLVATERFIQKYGTPRAMPELLELPIVLRNRDVSQTWQAVLQENQLEMRSLKNTFCVSTTTGMLQAVLADVGIAVMPGYIAEQCGLKTINIEDGFPPTEFEIAHIDNFLTRQWADQLKQMLNSHWASLTSVTFLI